LIAAIATFALVDAAWRFLRLAIRSLL